VAYLFGKKAAYEIIGYYAYGRNTDKNRIVFLEHFMRVPAAPCLNS
jgi:hypothetical protein